MERQRVENPSFFSSPEYLARNVCERNGINITENQFISLIRFVRLLKESNTSVNLLSRTDIGNIWTSHILHSISPLFYLDIPHGATVLDLGSGGGLPGIPLSILRDDLRVTLLDSIAKKTAALEWIIAEAGLTNVSVVTARAEELGKQPAHRFDIVVARAVASLSDLIKWSKLLVRKPVENQMQSSEHDSGKQRKLGLPCLLALKGGNLENEIATAKRKTGERNITTIDLVFSGADNAGLEDKKLVTVEF